MHNLMDGPGTVRVTQVYGDALTLEEYRSIYAQMVRGLSE